MRALAIGAVFWLVTVLVLAGAARAVPVDGSATEAPAKDKSAPVTRPGEARTLVAQLGSADWQVREKAMRALIALGNAARPALREALGNEDPEVRWRAIYALSLVDIDLLPTQPDAARTLYASAARARLQKDGLETARRLYTEVLQRFPETRWAAAARERLAALQPQPRQTEPKPTPQAIAQLIAQLGQDSWAERQEASRRLAQLGEAARAALEAAAQGPDPEVAWRARQLLRRLEAAEPSDEPKTGGGRPKLMVELLEKAQRAKTQPAQPSDLDALVRSLSRDDPGEVARAREVLLNIGKDAVAPLIRALETCDETTGVEIMDLLRQITRQELGFDPDRWQAWWRARQERGND